MKVEAFETMEKPLTSPEKINTQSVENNEDLVAGLASEAKLSSAEELEKQSELTNVRGSISAETEGANKEAEKASLERRRAYINAGIDLIVNSLQQKIDKPSFMAKMFKLPAEYNLQLAGIENSVRANALESGKIDWNILRANNGAIESSTIKEIEAMADKYLTADDKIALSVSDQVKKTLKNSPFSAQDFQG